ncbi:TonB-dependent receptor [Rubrivivax albus]|uniref:TonB-dependent receptor n=1 Tax=Rubrivivax albus TaxID=2499835 RepID=A0A3S2TNA2_9BURK|nr:TonB-dependent receptor [Rubrivivax albus]RVT52589.1 TonB-dependent receptor [Rubrivivax albus]
MRALKKLPPHHAVALAVLALPQAGAWAQQTTQLQTVTITAERREESIKDVPNSVSTLAGEFLDVLNTSGQDVRGLSGRVPSLNIESSFGRAFPRFYIRGYGNTDFRLNASQPVSLVYDDVVQENPILKGFPAFDLAQIEVARGPQGTLFGRNTPAGVVKFDSVRPGRTMEGYGSIGIGTLGTTNLEGAMTIPLSPTVSTRISVLDQRRSDWVDNDYDAGPTQKLEGYRDSALRAQLRVEPSKDFSALFNLHARDLDGSARLFRANIIEPGTNDLVDGFDRETVFYDGKNESKLQTVGGSARLKWNLGAVTLHSITGYESLDTFNRGDIDGGFGASFLPDSGPGVIPFASETADGIPKHRQLTQEFRVESNGSGALGWQAGVYLFDESYDVESFSYDSLAGGAQDGYQRIRQSNDASALFGALTWQATPALQLRGGLRFSRDKKKLSVLEYTNSGFVPCVLSGKCTLAELAAQEPDGDLSASPSDSKTNWDLSAVYALNKDVNIFARAATGFRASSVQSASAFNGKSVAGPENNTSLEIGAKADLFDKRARVSFSAFSYTVKDLQLTAVGGAANANILLNAEKATGQGFELDLTAYLTENILMTLGVGYNDTKIKDPGLAVAVCASCTVTDPLTPGGQALIDGNPLPQAPKVTTNLVLRYGREIAGGDFYVLTDWAYRSKVNFFLYESTEFTGKASLEGGLRVGYIWGNGKYEAAIYGRNITDTVRIVGGIDFNNLTGFINEPRTWGVQFKALF